MPQLDFPWEREAMRGEPMPDNLPLYEQDAYQALSYLYARYKQNFISRDDASKEKKLIRAKYEKRKSIEELSKRLCEHRIKTVQKTEVYYWKFKKAGSDAEKIEAAEKMINAIDGFPDNKLSADD